MGQLREHISLPLFDSACRWRLRLSEAKYTLLRNMLSWKFDGMWKSAQVAQADVSLVPDSEADIFAPRLATLDSIKRSAVSETKEFQLLQSENGGRAEVDFHQLFSYVVNKERQAGGNLETTVGTMRVRWMS